MKNDKSISFYFCLRTNTSVTVSDLRYSNGNRPDVCSVYLNEIEVGIVITDTPSTKGDNWNIFFSSNGIGSSVLGKGWHILKILVHGSDGVELDSITLDIADEKLTQDFLNCKLQCLDNLPNRKSRHNPNVYREAALFQRSYATRCAEEDNVKIPVYLDDVEEYKLTASLPMYKAFANRRGENTTGCPFLSPHYWSFMNFNATGGNITLKSSSAILNIFRQHRLFGSVIHIRITFSLQGQTNGHIDAEIGSILSLRIKPIYATVILLGTFKGRNKRLSYLNGSALLPGNRDCTWNIPDFTWSDVGENEITISMHTVSAVPLYIEEIRLERRPLKPERVVPIFKSDDLIIETVQVDFWWKAPESMTLWLQNSNSVFYHVHFFRISLPVPWADGFAQVFVLYQDGNVRLLPLPPSGLDWIPFGSSVVVGSANPNDLRPSAAINQVDINTDGRQMTLHYTNGETAKLTLASNLDKTELIVSDLRFQDSSRRFPFATFRSMYVEDGNSDCDSVMVDGVDVYNIMEKWKYVQGKFFLFFRRCESKHLTLSPDVSLELTRTRKPLPFIFNDVWPNAIYKNDRTK